MERNDSISFEAKELEARTATVDAPGPTAIRQVVYDEEDAWIPGPEPDPETPAWYDGSYRVGNHTSIAGDFCDALDRAASIGANALQIFSASPRMWPGGVEGHRPGSRRLAPDETHRFRARRRELRLGPLVIHANYLINLASPDRMLRVRSAQAFHDELARAESLGADFLVVHPGSNKGGDPRQAVEAVADSLVQAAKGIKFENRGHRLRILIENTSGMGNALGWRLEELRAILDAWNRIMPAALVGTEPGICLDTAHLFEAGYPIHLEDGLEKVVAHVDSTVGWNRVLVIHVNDSKTPFGSRVDRHEHIGKGKIGAKALGRFLTHPIISSQTEAGHRRGYLLETPIEKEGDDKRNVRKVMDLIGLILPKPRRPRAKRKLSARAAKKSLRAKRKRATPKKKRRKRGR